MGELYIARVGGSDLQIAISTEDTVQIAKDWLKGIQRDWRGAVCFS